LKKSNIPLLEKEGGCAIKERREATLFRTDGRDARARQREAVNVVSSAKSSGLKFSPV
jgi:hypothetical protein